MINDKLTGALTSAAAFRRLAKARLPREPMDVTLRAPGASDFDLNPDGLDVALTAPPRPAAVLVPVVARPEPSVLFTLRTNELPSHAGQISFPGGKLEPGETPLAAALREAREEIGLPANFAEILGFLPAYETATGYRITPVVALIDSQAAFAIEPREVAEVFEAPLGFVLDAAKMAIEAREWRGITRRFYAMRYGDRYIWGATAGIITALRRALTTTDTAE